MPTRQPTAAVALAEQMGSRHARAAAEHKARLAGCRGAPAAAMDAHSLQPGARCAPRCACAQRVRSACVRTQAAPCCGLTRLARRAGGRASGETGSLRAGASDAGSAAAPRCASPLPRGSVQRLAAGMEQRIQAASPQVTPGGTPRSGCSTPVRGARGRPSQPVSVALLRVAQCWWHWERQAALACCCPSFQQSRLGAARGAPRAARGLQSRRPTLASERAGLGGAGGGSRGRGVCGGAQPGRGAAGGRRAARPRTAQRTGLAPGHAPRRAAARGVAGEAARPGPRRRAGRPRRCAPALPAGGLPRCSAPWAR